VSWLDQAVAVHGEFGHAVEQVVHDFKAALAPGEHAVGPTTLLARAADLARSDMFAWFEAALHSQEHLSRIAPRRIGRSASLTRALVMATVAADLYFGYDTLRLRNRYTPQLIAGSTGSSSISAAPRVCCIWPARWAARSSRLAS
jgi:hypothetical protein